MNKDQNKIKNFFLKNPFLRKARNFSRHTLVPFLTRAVVILTTLLVFIFIVLKVFKPVLLEKFYNKSTSYFFQILRSSNREFNQINIAGNSRVSKEEIIEVVNNFKRNNVEKNHIQNCQLLIQTLIDEIKTKLPWINQIVITCSMPNVLNISVTEYEPFAIWQNDGKKYIIDKEGNTVPFEDLEEFRNMVILSGKGANTRAKSLFNIFAVDANLSENVYSATWTGSRRWDIRFNNGLLIKLPETNISDAWHSLLKIYNMPGSIVGLKIIDLRIAGKVYLEYDDSVIKEIKQL